MATKFFLNRATSDVSGSRIASLVAGDGTGLQTGVANTTAAGTQIQMTDTAGGTVAVWMTAPLNAVTISGSFTPNFWMSENNMSANVGAGVQITLCSAAGVSTGLGLLSGPQSVNATELPVTTRAAQNGAKTPISNPVGLGQRLRIEVWGVNIGTMATGFTFDLGYNGTTAAADGDSWVQFTETITEQVVTQIPYFNAMPPFLAQ